MAFVDILKSRLNYIQNHVKSNPPTLITQEIEFGIFEFDLSNDIDASNIVNKIYQFKKQYPISNNSNVHAWHSGYDTHKITDDFINLINVIEQRVNLTTKLNPYVSGNMFAKVAESWAITYDKDDYTNWHNHGIYNYSAVYYASASEDSAPLIFKKSKDQLLEIKPKTNKLVIFPGYANHMVPKINNDGKRICFSANLFLIEK